MPKFELEKVKQLFTGHAWVQKLLGDQQVQENEEQHDGVVAISDSHGLGLAYLEVDDDKILLKAASYASLVDLDEKKVALQEFVNKHQLQNMPCMYVTPKKNYKLSIIEPPKVPKDELYQALRFAVEDMIDYSIDEAMIDMFQLPLPRASDNATIAYAVTMRESLQEPVIEMVEEAGLSLKVIDIPEFSLRNLAQLHEADEKGVMIVTMHEHGTQLILSRKSSLYVSRNIEIELSKYLEVASGDLQASDAMQDEIIDSFSLDLQRSLDYCRSLYRQTPINSILVLPSIVNVSLMQECFKQSLGLPADTFNFERYMQVEEGLHDVLKQTDVQLAIGIGLRAMPKPTHLARVSSEQNMENNHVSAD